MVLAIGVDLIEISRIKKFVEQKSTKQLIRIFTEQEIDYAFSSISHKYARLAVRFAVKEAFFKACGYGIFHEIELCHDKNLKPEIRLFGQTALKFPKDYQILVSVSHSDFYATATVLIQQIIPSS